MEEGQGDNPPGTAAEQLTPPPAEASQTVEKTEEQKKPKQYLIESTK